MKKIILLAFCSLYIFTFQELFSQEIEANVSVNVEQLTFEARNFVSSMKFDLERYINNNRFLDKDWEGPKIQVEINIVLAGGTNQRYAGRLFIISKRMLDGPNAGSSINVRTYDDKWTFDYMQNSSISYDLFKFNEFSSLIDYYMLVIIGFDLDTYGDLEGSPAFDLAQKIVLLGANKNAEGFEAFSKPGEFNKYNLINELTDIRLFPLRRLFFDYYAKGLDQMAFDKEKGIKGVETVINDMYNFKKDKLSSRSILMQAFFDSKAQEIASIFKNYTEISVFDKLKYLDAGNSTLYENAKTGKE
jgi:hypothetical protein